MWPEGDQTQELLNGIKAGDPAAVNRLMDRHRQAVRRMIQMRLDGALSTRVDASDVVQDVLFEASRRMDNYISNPTIPFHLWLRQLAKDRIIDMHRRHRTAERRSVDREQPIASLGNDDRSTADLAALLKDAELTPAAATVRKEMENRFLEALNELPNDDRELILMRHFEHLGNGEVAEALNLTPAAAGMRYLRAIRKLRQALGTDEESQDN